MILIFSGITNALALIFMRETYAPVILERKTARMRKANNNPHLRSKLDRGIPAGQILKRSIVLPLKLLLFSPVVGLISVYVAFAYGLTFLLFATFPEVFGEQYGFSAGISGLAYLGIGLGYFIGIGIFTRFSDKLLEAQAAKDALVSDARRAQDEEDRVPEVSNKTEEETELETAKKDVEDKGENVDEGSKEPDSKTVGPADTEKKFKFKPEYRLFLMLILSPIMPFGFFIYGWTADKVVHWIAPIIGTALIGVSQS